MKPITILCTLLFLFVACKDSSVTDEIKTLKESLAKAEATINEFKEKDQDLKFIHTVYFWLKEDISAEEKETFLKGLKNLGTISSVGEMIIGPPAGTPREVVDNSYDYALIIHFKDKAAHDIYQDHQSHLDFIEASKGAWTRVQVYDNLVEG